MALKIWVGKRESDILTYKFFDISITFWGSNTNNNHSFCTTERIKDNYGNRFTQYVLKLLLLYISHNKNLDIEIHFYNNSFAYKLINLEASLRDYIVNINPQRIFDIVRHKTLSRVWLQNTIDVPQSAYLSKDECQYNKLLNKFPRHKKFIIQKSISGGGDGTYLMHKNNWEDVIDKLDKDDIFLVSSYYEDNISLSCHLIIDNKRVTVFPVSEQLLRYDENRICYCGNKYLDNNSKLSINIKKVATTIGHKLKEIDYRGICGLDFIFSENRIMLVEINPRFQGSSYLINAELKKANLPSLFELNTIAFHDCISTSISQKIEIIKVSYESHTCVYNKCLPNVMNYPQNVHLFLDGLLSADICENGVYLYRYLKE